MSSVSSVSSSANPYQTQSSSQGVYAQIGKDFLAIGSALQSGSLSDAQNALATFQQSVSTNLQNSASQLFSANDQASSAFQSLVSALNSGDSAGALKAYSNLQAALQNSQTTQAPQSASRGHHHHHHGGGSSAESSSSSTNPNSSSGGLSVVNSSSTSRTNSGPTADSDGDNDGSSLNTTA